MMIVISHEQSTFILNLKKLWAIFENKREKNKDNVSTGKEVIKGDT